MNSCIHQIIDKGVDYYVSTIQECITMFSTVISTMKERDILHINKKDNDLKFYISLDGAFFHSMHVEDDGFFDLYFTEEYNAKNKLDAFGAKDKSAIDFHYIKNNNNFMLFDSLNGKKQINTEFDIIEIDSDESRFQYSTIYNELELFSLELYYKFLGTNTFFYITLDRIEEIHSTLQQILDNIPKYIESKQ